MDIDSDNRANQGERLLSSSLRQTQRRLRTTGDTNRQTILNGESACLSSLAISLRTVLVTAINSMNSLALHICDLGSDKHPSQTNELKNISIQVPNKSQYNKRLSAIPEKTHLFVNSVGQMMGHK